MLLCSVLDLNAFERQNKAEGLGMVTEEGCSKSQSDVCGGITDVMTPLVTLSFMKYFSHAYLKFTAFFFFCRIFRSGLKVHL